MRALIFLFTMVFAFMGTQPIFANPCHLVLFENVRHLNQRDVRLEKRGLFHPTDGTSRLCGPVSLVNAISEIHYQLGTPRRSSPIDDVESIVMKLAPSIGVTSDCIRNRGLWAFDLAQVAEELFKLQNTEVTLKSFGVYASKQELLTPEEIKGETIGATEIPLAEILAKVKAPNVAAIMNFQFYPKDFPTEKVDPTTKEGALGGHYTVLRGRVPRSKDTLSLNDPYYGDVTSRLKPLKLEQYPVNTYEIEFDSHFKTDRRYFVTSIILIEVH